MKKIIFLLFIFLLSFVSFSEANQDEIVSGDIVTGYRMLPIISGTKDYQFTVYRGDYIKFTLPETMGPQVFEIIELKYKDQIFPDPEKSPYFKMKTTGTYAFTLGDLSGTINVIELERPNYTAVTADEGAQILANLKPFILDVRTEQENRQIYIDGTTLIPIQQLQARVGELESRKHDDVFIYCATGNRSTVAARILANLGFKRIYNLRYGIHDWHQRGYPVVKGK